MLVLGKDPKRSTKIVCGMNVRRHFVNFDKQVGVGGGG